MADVIELRPGKDVFEDHALAGADLAEVVDIALGPAGDAVVEEDAAGAEQAVDLTEIGRIVGDADVLVHADAGNLVVGAVERQVVGERHGHPVGQAEPPDLGLAIVVLRLRQGHAMGGDAVVLGGVAQQRAPAAADVEEQLPRLQPQLAADDVELVPLRLLQRVGPVAEIGAGIDHLRVEEELVEFVAGIVVELDEIPVPIFCAPPRRVAAVEFVADRRPAVAGQQQAQRPGPGKALAQLAEADSGGLPAPARRLDEADQIAALDLDVAADVAPEQMIERRPAQQRPQDPRSADRDHGRVVGHVAAEGDHGAVPEPDRERGIDLAREMAEDVPCRFDAALAQTGLLRGWRSAGHDRGMPALWPIIGRSGADRQPRSRPGPAAVTDAPPRRPKRPKPHRRQPA